LVKKSIFKRAIKVELRAIKVELRAIKVELKESIVLNSWLLPANYISRIANSKIYLRIKAYLPTLPLFIF